MAEGRLIVYTEGSARDLRADQDGMLSICLCLVLKGVFLWNLVLETGRE